MVEAHARRRPARPARRSPPRSRRRAASISVDQRGGVGLVVVRGRERRRRSARAARRSTASACRRPGRRRSSGGTCRRGSRRARWPAGAGRAARAASWACSAILIATSTPTEPESARKTCSRPGGVSSTSVVASSDRRLVGEPAEHHVAHPAGLVGQGGVEDRVAVAVDRGPPGGHAVDQLTAVGQPQPDALGALDQVGVGAPGHRPVGMPDVRPVEPDQVAGGMPGRPGPPSRLAPTVANGRRRACGRPGRCARHRPGRPRAPGPAPGR